MKLHVSREELAARLGLKPHENGESDPSNSGRGPVPPLEWRASERERKPAAKGSRR